MDPDNVTIFRVEEIHLIAAEGHLRAGNSSKALLTLNNVTGLRGGSLYTEATLDNILNERRKELYCELLEDFMIFQELDKICL